MPPEKRLIHSVRFFNPVPSPIHSLAVCKESQQKLLALSRSNNDIEIWSLGTIFKGKSRKDLGERTPRHPAQAMLLKWIPGNSESSVEGLIWAHGRLFSTGLHGLVLEHDLTTLSTRRQFAVTAGPAWCIDYSEIQNRIAVGTEEGYISLFEVTDDGLLFDRTLDKQEGRVLCLSWHSSGDRIVSGSSDTIRIWNVLTGSPIARITTGRLEKHKETIVWSVKVMDDMTIISGDSRGKTCFWNGSLGTLLDAYDTHRADVLAVAVTPDQTKAFSAGVDPTLMHFQPIVKSSGKRKWVSSVKRMAHTHDVRTLLADDQTVISAGLDSRLIFTHLDRRTENIFPPLPAGHSVIVAREANLMVLRYRNYLDIWRLGSGEKPDIKELEEGYSLDIKSKPVKVLTLKTKDEEAIRCCSISSDGQWIAYATATRMRLFRLEDFHTPTPSLTRANVKADSDLEIAHLLAFFREGTQSDKWGMISATQEGHVQFLEIDQESERVSCSATLKQDRLGLKQSISHLQCSRDVAVIADYLGNVVSLDLKNRKVLAKMPKYDNTAAVISALSLSEDDHVIIVYSDHTIHECKARSGKFSKFSSELGRLEVLWRRGRKFCTKGAFQDSSNRIVAFDEENIFVIDREQQPDSTTRTTKMRRKTSSSAKAPPDEDEKEEQPHPVHVLKKYRYLVHLDQTSDGSMVAVEVKPGSLEEQLPPSLKIKKFGVM